MCIKHICAVQIYVLFKNMCSSNICAVQIYEQFKYTCIKPKFTLKVYVQFKYERCFSYIIKKLLTVALENKIFFWY